MAYLESMKEVWRAVSTTHPRAGQSYAAYRRLLAELRTPLIIRDRAGVTQSYIEALRADLPRELGSALKEVPGLGDMVWQPCTVTMSGSPNEHPDIDVRLPDGRSCSTVADMENLAENAVLNHLWAINFTCMIRDSTVNDDGDLTEEARYDLNAMLQHVKIVATVHNTATRAMSGSTAAELALAAKGGSLVVQHDLEVKITDKSAFARETIDAAHEEDEDAIADLAAFEAKQTPRFFLEMLCRHKWGHKGFKKQQKGMRDFEQHFFAPWGWFLPYLVDEEEAEDGAFALGDDYYCIHDDAGTAGDCWPLAKSPNLGRGVVHADTMLDAIRNVLVVFGVDCRAFWLDCSICERLDCLDQVRAYLRIGETMGIQYDGGIEGVLRYLCTQRRVHYVPPGEDDEEFARDPAPGGTVEVNNAATFQLLRQRLLWMTSASPSLSSCMPDVEGLTITFRSEGHCTVQSTPAMGGWFEDGMKSHLVMRAAPPLGWENPPAFPFLNGPETLHLRAVGGDWVLTEPEAEPAAKRAKVAVAEADEPAAKRAKVAVAEA